jgi:thymidylate kinase
LGIDIEYLRELDTEYNNLISKLPCEVIIVDAERTPEEIHEEIIRLLQ